MDFIDFDSFLDLAKPGTTSNLPQPQPALSLPISSNIETFGKRFTNLNNLTRNLLSLDDKLNEPSQPHEPVRESELARKYAQLSIDLLKKQHQHQQNGDDGTGTDPSAVPATTSSSATASLSSRLSRVFNNQLNDSLTREIFNTLEDKFPETDSIKELIEPGSTGSLARKRLRGKVEGELVKNQTLVLKEYQPVMSQLKALEESLSRLNQLNESLNSKVDKNFETSNSFNSKIKALTDEKKMISLKKNLLIGFKEKFTLNEYEQYVLSSGDINDEFFQVLKKAEQINENCSILLAIDNPQLGLKIMSKINQLINTSIDRIISFCNKTLSNLYSLNSKSKLLTLHQCLRFLKNKLNYFNTIMALFTESRSKILIDEFLSETSTDGKKSGDHDSYHGGNSRPVFISENDTVRYIGDLLAYVHSVVVNETDLIASIFTIEGLDTQEKAEFDQIINQIKDEVLKSMARPVKSRINQVVSSETKLLTIYSIFNLVELYSLMLSKQLSSSNELLRTINELIKSSRDRILDVINSRFLTIKNSNLAVLELNFDLQPPEWIIEYFADLLPILDQIVSSSTSTSTVLNFNEKENKEFLSLIIDRPIEIFNEHVQTNKLFNVKQDQLILRQNFLDLILSKIIPISILSDKVLELNEQISGLTKELTQIQLDYLLKGCLLYDHFNIINMIYPFNDEESGDDFEPAIYEAIKENKLFNIQEMAKVNVLVQEFLPNALLEIQRSLLKLNSPMVVNDIVNDSGEEFVKFYHKFGLVVKNFLDFDFTWSQNEVSLLLGGQNEGVLIQ
ncbi:COG6-domain-containing protein [Suhomyces tanzawaensis NRRL Y-17324]|uniref:Conserved oligomeric Golgi complex subunit 6 n=1 Tax=Suhomyces tanzawaensis NRRL Y-17324 TaxID=984487 RepID=A0A1E4SAY3_9ASCO|nr:COG6-domain-containing protein [Suhomyces tanzawaensis NRRL Y-17324]ODV76636.1 COG6-domain-containing protein [Suhomyces tanzawaensis NRRL Y-17324]